MGRRLTIFAPRKAARLAGAACVLLSAATVRAGEESPYCRAVRARAVGDAALLFSPSLLAQGIRFPRNGTTDSGVTTGEGYQFRAGLSFSATDFYKGFRVLRAADADCQQHDAVQDAQQLLLQADDAGRLPALRKQAAFLDSRRATWEELSARSDERVARQITPLLDAQEIHARRSQLEHKRLQITADIERLEARGLASPSAPAALLSSAVDRAAMHFEHEASHIRTLDAWSLTLTGGLIPEASSVDTYGIVQLGFNVGGIVRYRKESRYLGERARELQTARYEMHDQLRRLDSQLQRSRSLVVQELALIDGELARLASARASLERAEAPNAQHALALVTLDAISVEADRVYFDALAAELGRLQGTTP